MPEWLRWKRGGEWVYNDEGYHYAYCHSCGRKTEHELSTCLSCENYQRAKPKKAKVKDYIVTKKSNGNMTCTCKGFKYRRTCKHLKLATFE